VFLNGECIHKILLLYTESNPVFEFLKRIYCKESVEQTILQLLMICSCLLTEICNVFCKYRAVVSSCDFALFKGCEVLAKGFYLSCN